MPVHDHSTRWLRLAVALLVLGLGLQVWLWLRAWAYWDQVVLLRLGMELALEGEVAAFAKSVSGGGVVPGALLQLVVGSPLALWFDYRSPGLVLGLSHVAAVLVLWAALRPALGARFWALFLAVYWLSPWRLFHSGFLWEPHYLLLPAALHLWAALASREGARLVPSLTLGAVAVLGPQLHPSGALLGLVVLLLWLSRWIRLHLVGFGLGLIAGAATLAPTLRAAFAGSLPALTPAGGIGDWGLVQVHPLLRMLGYWLRLGSLDVGRRVRQIALADELGAELADGLVVTLAVIVTASSVIALAGNVHGARLLLRRTGGARGFLLRYAALFLLAELAAVAVSPITPQGWHLLVGLHAACLPVVLWTEHLLDRPAAGAPRRVWLAATALFLVLRLPVVLALGWGHPMYRIPSDPVERARLAPERLSTVEPQKPPFGD